MINQTDYLHATDKIKLLLPTENVTNELYEIEKECFKGEAWKKEFIFDSLNDTNGATLAYIESDKILGYLMFSLMLEEMQISNLAVKTAHRRQGIARALLCYGEAYAKRRGCEYAELEVNAKNCGAIALYEKCGYSRVGIRKNYYAESENGERNAYTMTKQL